MFDHLRRKDPSLGRLELDVEELKKPGVHVFDNLSLQFKNSKCNPSVSFEIEYISVEDALKDMDKGVDSHAWYDHADHDCDSLHWRGLASKSMRGNIQMAPVVYIDNIFSGTQVSKFSSDTFLFFSRLGFMLMKKKSWSLPPFVERRQRVSKTFAQT